MPNLDLTKSYEDGQTPSELDIDGLALPLQTFLNTTKIDSDNIQTSAITTALIDDGAVTAAKIAAGNVTRAKLATFNYTLSSSSGSFATFSASFVDVTNLSATITTLGRPVRIVVISANNSSANSLVGFGGFAASDTVSIRIIRDGSTAVSSMTLAAGSLGGGTVGCGIPCSVISHIDVVGAGTYTYKIQLAIGSGAGVCGITEGKLLVYEIP